MTVVSDSSPLIILAKIGRLGLLYRLYQAVAITPQVYHEVVVAGAGLAGAVEVATSKWIQVKPVKNPSVLVELRMKFGLGLGELSAIILGRNSTLASY